MDDQFTGRLDSDSQMELVQLRRTLNTVSYSMIGVSYVVGNFSVFGDSLSWVLAAPIVLVAMLIGWQLKDRLSSKETLRINDVLILVVAIGLTYMVISR